MALSDITVEAVRAAIEEYDRIGRASFLKKYGFRKSRGYVLRYGARDYDSKAIAAAAHGFVPNSSPLDWRDFSGGKAGAARLLIDLGFEVQSPALNADWTREELILALELYLSDPVSPPGKTSPEVADLSKFLGALGVRTGASRNDDYRNANGVYLKMMNFRRFDPRFTAQGKVGMNRGNALERPIWDEFSDDVPALSAAAAVIRAAIADLDLDLSGGTDDDEGADEGRVFWRLHRARERNAKLVAKRKRLAFEKAGRLVCEVCEFDFEAQFGEVGSNFMEAHHVRPIAAMMPGDKTRVDDLALVCANCHRMLHRRRPPYTIEELRARLLPTSEVATAG